MGSQRVRVDGLNELRRALKEISADAPKELRDALKVAAERVAMATRAKMPHRSGRAAASVKVRAKATGASLVAGGARVPYYAWLDFGGSVGKGHKPGVADSGSVKRPMLKPGRYLYPSIYEHQEQTAADVDAAMRDIARRHGFDQRGHAD